jgi:ATP-dependent Clp protease ATP-binding subunit ClpA
LSKNKATKLSLLAIGNSGVGKTLIAKTLSKDILGNEKYLVRFDMSEYADETSVNKLIGSSSGYVGYHDGGLLTEAIKRNKYCVLLLDEIEKANQKVFNLFLQILDEGFITDNMGQKVDFKNTYIIMTSNVGTKQALGHKTIGFDGNNINNNKDIIKKEMKHVFPPEFLNRFDNILIFNPLTDNNLKDIIKIELNYLHNRINEIGHTLEFNDDIVEYIFKEINDEKEYGARPIKRVIKTLIEDAIADFIINNDIEHYNFKLIITDNKITIK